MNSYSEAITIASTFDVLGSNSPLSRKLTLNNEADWIEFMSKSGAVSGSSGDVAINLEKLLRYCFDIAFKLPPSPSSKVTRRSASHSNSPTPLQI